MNVVRNRLVSAERFRTSFGHLRNRFPVVYSSSPLALHCCAWQTWAFIFAFLPSGAICRFPAHFPVSNFLGDYSIGRKRRALPFLSQYHQ
jgi:hypothetical protein